jgi:hypothetical protein
VEGNLKPLLLLLYLLAVGVPVRGQEADRVAPASRAESIEAQRRDKAQKLEPDNPTGVENVLEDVKRDKVLERITSGVGGLRFRLGGLASGTGFAIGPEYYRTFLHDQGLFRTSIRGSTSRSYLMDTELRFPDLAREHAFVNLYAVHSNLTRLNYYGPGPNSARTGRSVFRLENTSFQFRTGLKPVKPLRLGVIGEYLMVNVGPGRHNDFISSDRTFFEPTTPGIQQQTDFYHGGAYVQLDWRDNPGGPRSGGNYIAQISKYIDRNSLGYSFNRLDLEAQQYIPLFEQRRVFALRGRIMATDPHRGNRVPFYLQPTVGGSDDLRGFRQFRFYDNNSFVLNGEYRWEIFSGLDMALFVDAGRVFPRWQDINIRDLETSYGFGFRFNVRNDVFMRIDTGFSREGFALWVKFGNVF